MNKTWVRVLGIVLVGGLLATACSNDDDTSGDVATRSFQQAGQNGGVADAEALGGQEPAGNPAGDPATVVDPEEGTCAAEELVCIGLVTDVGTVDDRGRNQSTWEGIQRLEVEMEARIDFVETQDPADFGPNIQALIDREYDVVVTVGVAAAEATIAAATANPKTYFVGVEQPQPVARANLAGLIFEEDKAGFLAGALAGLLTETGTVAQVLATDVPPIVGFKAGFEAGVAHTSSDTTVLSTYHPSVPEVAFDDEDWGARTAREALSNGADVLFAVGGSTGEGALREVAKEGGRALCIGVDIDQWFTVPDAQPCLVTSAVKLIEPGVVDIIGRWRSGDAPRGDVFGAVGFADYHEFSEVVGPDIHATLTELVPSVVSGEIPTGYQR